MNPSIKRVTGMVLLCSSCLAGPALAEKTDRSKPIQIEADSVRVDDADKTAVYRGHVILTQGTMTITADRIDVHQDAQGMASGVAVGQPVHFREKLDGKDEYMEGEAKRAEYDARTERLKLIGSARVKQGEDDVRGAVITYDMRTERYQAQGAGDGSSTGRVHAVIQPRKQDGQVKP